ncbi:MAG: hypothetical protein KGJ46_01480 [Xanthomonadaceae bacterium]|nr:hypothetical protein [Xanthomonadaceae bacterium]
MRSEPNGVLDRVVPAAVVPYAIWTMYVHLITATRSSFVTLLQGLPLVALIAIAATVGWFHLPDPARRSVAAATGSGAVGPADTLMVSPSSIRAKPLAVLALALLWVGLLSAGMPYPLFWWGALLATCWAWTGSLRNTSHIASGETDWRNDSSNPVAWKRARWIVALVAAAAVGVTLFVSRPDPDDALHLSIPATLLRFPQQPVLLHDTLYRLSDAPILAPFYRLTSYDVLIGALARITGLDHHVVAYLVLPPLFAAFGVLAWVYLLRRIVPARWHVVLVSVFLCVLALGEAHRAYGNFAFVRLFQGKAIMVTCMVPVIAGSAWSFARDGGVRCWLLLFAAQVAALGTAATALFVAPAAAALGLAGGWSADATGSRRFALGIPASVYVFAAAWIMTSATHGGHGFVSYNPMPAVPHMLDATWGWWSTRLLLVALLAAWAFVRDPVRARWFSAGAFFFLLAVLNPYTCRFVADHLVGVYTYWRLTWALPLPFFLAVVLDGVVVHALRITPKALAASAYVILAGLAITFGWRFGTLRAGNSATLGMPGLKVYSVEYPVAMQVAKAIPENGVVLAPELVAFWLPTFVVHPQLVGTGMAYLVQSFAPPEAARRRALMRYVAGEDRSADSAALFADALRRYRLTTVVLTHSAPWRLEIEGVLERHRWQPLACGAYDVWESSEGRPPVAHRDACGPESGTAPPG